MEYIILSSDSFWEFTNEFNTNSLTYEGANVWTATLLSGHVPVIGNWINPYNNPPENAVGIRAEILYYGHIHYPSITFTTNKANTSESYEINGDGNWHTVEWIYSPVDATEFVNNILISSPFGGTYAIASSIRNISYVYGKKIGRCTWTNKVDCDEVCGVYSE